MLLGNNLLNDEIKPHFAYKNTLHGHLFLTSLSNFVRILCSKTKMNSRTHQTCSQ